MRRIVSGMFLSLDGVAESPDRWVFPYFTDEVGKVVESSIESADAVLMGRRTYEEWAAYWPGKTAADDPFADFINPVRKYVVSSTLRSVEWENATLLGPNVAEEIAALKEQPGAGISVSGSVTLVGWLLRQGLLDELSLLVFPVMMGSGKRLFENDGGKVPLQLVDSRALDNGVLSLRYGPKEEHP